jgi:phosphatidylethanolamine-binding protein (PEBP) family uncharacterized protein
MVSCNRNCGRGRDLCPVNTVPTGSGWWHWTVVNIPATARSLPAGAGSTAPAGDEPHRYVFTLWALKVDKLDLTGEASGAMVGFNLHVNALGTATMTAVFGR